MSMAPGTSRTERYALRPSTSVSWGLIGTTVSPRSRNARNARLPNLRRSLDAPTIATTLGNGGGFRVLLHEFDETAASLFQILHRRRVRDADEPGRVECLARRDGDARFVEQRLRKIGGRAEAVHAEDIADVHEQVERAGRLAAAQPRIHGQ